MLQGGFKVEKTARFGVLGPSKAKEQKPKKEEAAASTVANDVKEAKPAAKKEAAPAKEKVKSPPSPKKAPAAVVPKISADTIPQSAAAVLVDGLDHDALAAAVTRQGAVVKQMKKDGIQGDALAAEIKKLQEAKATLETARASVVVTDTFDRKAFDDAIIRRMFVIPSFEIHGGVAGLFDLGPPACGLKANVIDTWRRHFVLAENMLEMECTNLTPYSVLKTSGHVDKFTDLMVKDLSTGEPYRADKLLEDFIDTLIETTPTMPSAEIEEHRRVQRQADAYTPEELDGILKKYGVKSALGNDLSSPFPFNLMFQTTIGPEGTNVGYLRPETAQGLFVNFRRLLEYNSGRIPFAAAQVGMGFRNEIAPRNGLLRVREFCMAEIEHFVHPTNKAHSNFDAVADQALVLFCREDQLGSGRTQTLTIGHAVEKGMVNNQTLGYFMARTQLFLEKIGMDPERMRFRQHLSTEMAHYAADCWDMEIKTSFGWVECVGHADRACYDLQVHGEQTGCNMSASQLCEPYKATFYKFEGDKKQIGMQFKAEQRNVVLALEALGENEKDVLALEAKLDADGKATIDKYEVNRSMIKWKKIEKMVQEEKFTPSVIEPSFGIGRVLYSLLEHSFYTRDGDEQRAVFKFKPSVAPIKCGIFPLSGQDQFYPIINSITAELSEIEIACRSDMSGASLGRRYARADEIGIPFGITVDFESVVDNSVTLRERDSMAQVRLSAKELPAVVQSLISGASKWEDVTRKYPVVRGAEEDGPATENGSVTKVERSAAATFSRPAVPIDTSNLKFKS